MIPGNMTVSFIFVYLAMVYTVPGGEPTKEYSVSAYKDDHLIHEFLIF